MSLLLSKNQFGEPKFSLIIELVIVPDYGVNRFSDIGDELQKKVAFRLLIQSVHMKEKLSLLSVMEIMFKSCFNCCKTDLVPRNFTF